MKVPPRMSRCREASSGLSAVQVPGASIVICTLLAQRAADRGPRMADSGLPTADYCDPSRFSNRSHNVVRTFKRA